MPADLLELLCRLRRGDPGAAGDLADAARPELTRLARARVRDASLVDDIVQEALLEVLATHAALRDPAALRAWLRLIVRKQADRVTRRIRPTSPLNDTADYADCADRPERLVERRGDVATVRRALSVVRDADALLLRLRYFGEWTDAELAGLVGASPGTVRKRIHAARGRLRSALDTKPVQSHRPQPEATMPELEKLLGRIVTPADVPAGDPITLSPSGRRLETTLKILDAVAPLELGGTVDLLGPVGLGQLVLVAEVAIHVHGVVVAAGRDRIFHGLIEDAVDVRAVVIDGDPSEAARAGDRLAGALAGGGETVLFVLDAAAWDAAPPSAGVVEEGSGSVTAFRFSPHPRDGEPAALLETAGTTLVYATEPFVNGLHPAIDVLASRSSLVERDLLDPVTIGTAHAARDLLRRANEVRTFLAQALAVGESYTGVPGEQVPAREATEQLAALVR